MQLLWDERKQSTGHLKCTSENNNKYMQLETSLIMNNWKRVGKLLCFLEIKIKKDFWQLFRRLKYLNVKLSITIIKLASFFAEVAGTLVGFSNSLVLILWGRDPLKHNISKTGKTPSNESFQHQPLDLTDQTWVLQRKTMDIVYCYCKTSRNTARSMCNAPSKLNKFQQWLKIGTN